MGNVINMFTRKELVPKQGEVMKTMRKQKAIMTFLQKAMHAHPDVVSAVLIVETSHGPIHIHATQQTVDELTEKWEAFDDYILFSEIT